MGWKESISKFFKRDKVAQSAEKGRGRTLEDPTKASIDNMNVAGAGMNSLKAALSMDQELMHRYADYERMDDYPTTSCALDIVAEDTTIPDSVRGKTIWAESEDKVLRDINMS